jgi:hypothetical protein
MAVARKTAAAVANVLGAELAPNQDWLRECADMGATRLDAYKRYEDYYNGNQGTRLTERAKTYLQACGLEFAENFCEVVVDAFAQRKRVVGFESEDDTLTEWATKTLWNELRMDAKQGTVHHVEALKGDAFLIAGIGVGRSGKRMPVLHYNPPEKVKVVYDEDDGDRIAYAVKAWTTSTTGVSNPGGQPVRRMNIYFPDRIEKYFTLASDNHNWARWLEPDPDDKQATRWPTPWVKATGEPRGVPVFHFRHKARGDTYGRSRIHGTLPQQDAFNKSAIDLFQVLDSMGFDQRYVITGVELGQLKLVPGELWKLPEGSQVGRLDAQDVDGLLKAMEAQLQRIGGRSKTPMTMLWLSGEPPTGEALKTAFAPLVGDVEESNVPDGNTWEDAVAHCAELWNDFSEDGLSLNPEAFASLSCVWDSPEPRNDESEVTVAEGKQRLGVSKRTLVRELGYDPDVEEQQRGEEADKAAEAAMKAFSAGGPGGFSQ